MQENNKTNDNNYIINKLNNNEKQINIINLDINNKSQSIESLDIKYENTNNVDANSESAANKKLLLSSENLNDNIYNEKNNFIESSNNIKNEPEKNLISCSSSSSNNNINSPNFISITSINENDTDTESITDTDDDNDDDDDNDSNDNINTDQESYVVKEFDNNQQDENVIKKDIVLLERQLNGNLLRPNDLNSHININNLSLTQNSGVTIGNTNNINYVIKQYFPNKNNGSNNGDNDNGNENSAYDNDEEKNIDNIITTGIVSKRRKRSTKQDNLEKKSEGKNSPDQSTKSVKQLILKSKYTLWGSGILISLILIISICLIVLQATKKNYNTGDGDDSNRENKPISSNIGDAILSPGQVLRMISRDEWVAQPPNDVLADLVLPVSRVIIIHTATEGCDTQAACTFRTRYIQTFHMESRNFDDIAYNFLIGGDGGIYVGRGWDKQGAHTKGYNVDSMGIAFIGTYIKIKPTEGQLNSCRLLIEEGIRLGKIKSDYKLYGHRNFIASESPGEELYKIIQNWQHFAGTNPQELQA